MPITRRGLFGLLMAAALGQRLPRLTTWRFPLFPPWEAYPPYYLLRGKERIIRIAADVNELKATLRAGRVEIERTTQGMKKLAKSLKRTKGQSWNSNRSKG